MGRIQQLRVLADERFNIFDGRRTVKSYAGDVLRCLLQGLGRGVLEHSGKHLSVALRRGCFVSHVAVATKVLRDARRRPSTCVPVPVHQAWESPGWTGETSRGREW